MPGQPGPALAIALVLLLVLALSFSWLGGLHRQRQLSGAALRATLQLVVVALVITAEPSSRSWVPFSDR